MKKKVLERKKARLNVCWYIQKKGEDYNKDETVAPVVNEITIRVVLLLMLILRMLGNVYNMEGAFFYRELTNERKIHIEVP